MATLTIQGTNTIDNYASQHSALQNSNWGAEDALGIISSDIPANNHIYIQFDFSALPAGSTITAAVLSIYFKDTGSPDPVGRTYWAYELTQTAWTEMQSTWIHYDTDNHWATAGGDYTTTDGASCVVPASASWMTWNVLALCQHFQSSHSKIANFLLRDGTEGTAGNPVAYFWSREYSEDTSLRPKLVITYDPPSKNMQLNIGDTFKTVTDVQLNIGDIWKPVTKAQINIGDSWKSVF
jgi:hypothetical protein